MIKSAKWLLAIAVTLASIGGSAAAAKAEALSQDIVAQTSKVGNAGEVVTYLLQDGSKISVPQLSKDVDLNSLTDSEIAELGLPAKPVDEDALREWIRDYSNTNTSGAPTDSLQLRSTANYATTTYTSLNWGGYVVGNVNSTVKQFVAVKGNFTAPTESASCTSSSNAAQGLWVGLGGTNTSGNDLVQQGIGWCNPVNSTGKWTPWYEFANTYAPVDFCGFSSWKIAPGHVLYNNMSYQTSSNTAYFYLEDQTSGVIHSCSVAKPTGWAFTGNTAECISEKLDGVPLANFGSVQFYNCQAQLSSTSAWIPFGSASTIDKINNVNLSNLALQTTGSLGADGKTFTMTFVRAK